MASAQKNPIGSSHAYSRKKAQHPDAKYITEPIQQVFFDNKTFNVIHPSELPNGLWPEACKHGFGVTMLPNGSTGYHPVDESVRQADDQSVDATSNPLVDPVDHVDPVDQIVGPLVENSHSNIATVPPVKNVPQQERDEHAAESEPAASKPDAIAT